MSEKEVTVKEEMEAMKYEPLDEVEMKLIKWSMGLGIFFLGVFYVISRYVGH